jgi:hypothetical protein
VMLTERADQFAPAGFAMAGEADYVDLKCG